MLASEPRPTAWQALALQDLAESGDARLHVVVVETLVASMSQTPRTSSSRLLWRGYNNGCVARRAVPVRRSSPSLLADSPSVIKVRPERVGTHGQAFPSEAIGALRELDLDVLLRFGFRILRGEILDVPRYGVWSFHHDDDRVIRGGPPSLWEVYEGRPTTGVLLQRLTDRLDAGISLERAVFRTVQHSYPRNRDEAAMGAAVLPAKVARAVRNGWLDPNEPSPAVDPLPPIRRNPTNRQMLTFVARQSRRAVVSRTKAVVVGDRWGVGVADAPTRPTSPDPRDPLPAQSVQRCRPSCRRAPRTSHRAAASRPTWWSRSDHRSP